MCNRTPDPSAYHSLLAGHISCFQGYLKQMVARRGAENKYDCGITFSETPPDGGQLPSLTAAKVNAVVLAGGGGDEIIRVPLDDPGDTQEQNRNDVRFVQFGFHKRSFFMDLPKTTLTAHEAELLLSQRHGFFRLRDRRWPDMSCQAWRNTVERFDPVQKEYLNGDEWTAAEDMAYILFTLWKFPPDWPLYYRALRFGASNRRAWEGTGPVVPDDSLNADADFGVRNPQDQPLGPTTPPAAEPPAGAPHPSSETSDDHPDFCEEMDDLPDGTGFIITGINPEPAPNPAHPADPPDADPAASAKTPAPPPDPRLGPE